MSNRCKSLLNLPQSVVDDVRDYRSHVRSFLAGETTAISFKSYRVPMGVYEQRVEGKYMVRIRIGAGLVLPHQLQRIAELSRNYGSGMVHVTTRQDIQIHEVDIENTPDVLEGLLEVGLAARGGGGNTVRNITACPRAGVCPQEEFDVAPYAIAAAEYLLQSASSFNLPRKYKIAFSGCPADCAYASVADLGFFAHKKAGVNGFAVYAAGGLGSHPRVGVKIEDFIQTDEVLLVAEAIKRLFDKHGDRSNKHRARLRYVLNRLGTTEFVRLYRQERDEVANQEILGAAPEIRHIGWRHAESASSPGSDRGPLSIPHNVMPEKTANLFTVRLKLNLGNVPADDLARIAGIADEFAQGFIRTTQLQDMLISGVPRKNIEEVIKALRQLSIDVIDSHGPKMVACAGASTCKLGLCLSRGLAHAIGKELQEHDIGTDANGPIIRISGCPNSCGHHHLADIGLEGRAKRINGRLMPFYDLLAGAKVAEGDSRLAERLGPVPAKRIPAMMADALTHGKIDKEGWATLVARYGEVPSEPPDEYYYDFGSDEPFSLAGRGPGECGVGVMDVIKVDIDQAKDSLKQADAASDSADKNERTYKAIVSAARALLFVFALEPKKDREIFTAFQEHIIKPGWVKQQTTDVIGAAMDWRMGDRDSIIELNDQVRELVERVEELFGSLDANLKFRVEPVAETQAVGTGQAAAYRADLRSVACPLNFVKAKLALEKVKPGEILEVLLDDGEPINNVPDSFAEQGQEIVEVTKIDNYFLVRIQRKK